MNDLRHIIDHTLLSIISSQVNFTKEKYNFEF